MHIIGTIFAVIGWILLGLLVLFLIVMIVPVRVRVELREGTFSLWVRLLGVFTVRILPPGESRLLQRLLKKKPEPAPPPASGPPPAAPPGTSAGPPNAGPSAPPQAEQGQETEKPKEEAAKAGEKKAKFSITFDFIMEVLSAAGVLMRRVFRALHFRKIALVLPIHKEDAAATALACGQTQAAVSAGVAALENFLDLRFDGVRILPDFTGDIKAGPYAYCELAARPGAMLLAALCALWRFLMLYRSDRKTNHTQKTEETK